MKERPILFSGPMVRAILAGTKTQTRRMVTNPHRNDEGYVLQDYGNGWWPYRSHDGESSCYIDRQKDGDYYSEAPLRCPYGQPGDRLWVRETWAWSGDGAVPAFDRVRKGEVWFRADPERTSPGIRWRPSIYMPRWASRISLEVTGVRVERLQDISEADAVAEGIERRGECNWRDYVDEYNDFTKAVRSYRSLWESINGHGSWDANPWVWVVSFNTPMTGGTSGQFES